MRDYQERTKSCHYYAAGRCLKGDLCTFAHDVSRPEAQQPWRRASAGQPSVGQSSDGLSSGSPQAWKRSGTIYPETGRVDSQKQNPTWGWKSGGNNKDWKRNDIDTPKWRRPSAGYQNDNTTSVDGESRSSDGPSGVWKRSGTSFRDAEIEKPNKKWGWNSGRSATQGWNRGGGNDANSAEGVPPWRRASSGNILRDAEKTETRGRWDRANSPEGYATNDYILPDTDSSDDDDTLSAGGTRLKSQRVGKQIARAGPSNAMPDPTSRERPTTKGPGWSEFSTWRQRLQLNGGAKLNRSQLRPLWEEAIEILKGNDTTLQQKLVEQLLQKGNLGRERIEQHINNDFPGLHYMKDYLHDSFAFIMFATLHELLNSLVMDQHVGTLYVIIFGTDGKQCSEFFERVTNQLAEELDPDSRSSKIWSNELNGKIVTFGRALAAISECLRQVLRRNTRARFQSELEKIVQSLCTIAASVDQQHDEFYPQTRAALREAVGIFRQANAIVDAPEVLPNAERKVTSTYNIPIDFPGYFSTAGPRHDNDHVRIEDIKILPTLSEILSQRNDFLPRKDPSAPHFFPNGTERLVDTHFRLLRYDYVAQLRDIVSGILRIFGLPEPERKRAFLTASRDNPGCYLYHNTVVECPIFDQRMGLRFRLGFSYPKEIYRMSGEKRQQWWEERKRLERGTLLCLIASSMAAQHICFLMVADKETAPDKKTGLSSGERANILVQPASPELEEDLKFLLAQTQVQPENLVLLEFPKIIPETFVPILANLKELGISGFLPLSQYIAPDGFDAFVTDSPGSVVTEILPPAYARSSGFMFDLSPILNNKTGHYSLSPRADPDDPEILKTLERLSPLDRGQCKALVTGLTQELSLIQGPPGCGKSWLGVRIVQVLLHANYGAAELGPILCVCYTNHALDQFLESLLDFGIENLIRIGGRSKSSRLEGKNLRIVGRTSANVGLEKYQIGQAYSRLEQIAEDGKDACNIISGNARSWNSVQRVLALHYTEVFHQFNDRYDAEGFEQQGSVVDRFRAWSSGKTPTQFSPRAGDQSIDAILSRPSIWQTTANERTMLIDHWVSLATESTVETLKDLVEGHRAASSELDAAHQEANRRLISTADVIGITTTGLAKNIKLLSKLNAKVVICEEAGEVLEGHLLNAILPSCQHLIQIGDHEQLRPQISQTLDLSMENDRGKQYRLDESMFERLVREDNCLSVAQLDVQRRMRPEISELIRQTIYPGLRDHPSVSTYPNVVGMNRNVYWLDHRHEEASPEEGTKSKSNDWEVKMVCSFVRHLVRQGIYGSEEIAVLTPYTGQLQKLRRHLGGTFEVVVSDRDQEALERDGLHFDPVALQGELKAAKKVGLDKLIRVATVDNFQGEEAGIVIISLVRSNEQGKVGFLKTKNRVNVLLSRAKQGMYIIGNAETAVTVPMWNDVCEILQKRDSIGTKLPLSCPRHPEKVILVEEPKDFLKFAPEGGCDLTCDKRLDECGHKCFSKCHSEQMHAVTTCSQPCNRLHPACQHPCPKICSDPCGKCLVPIDDVMLPCNHILMQVPCYRARFPERIECPRKVLKMVSDCGHNVEVVCGTDTGDSGFLCPTPCSGQLNCGHQCGGTCGACFVWDDGDDERELVVRTITHQPCGKTCRRGFTTCSHVCTKRCHDGTDCGVCRALCEVKCGHTRCTKFCSDSCAPCAELCQWTCEHKGQCPLPCAAPCERLPCAERCGRKLSCGHQCPTVCGELCPGQEYCQICCMDDKRGQEVDMLMFSTYGSVDLDTEPILILSCGHFFIRETMDLHIRLDKVYCTDENGDFNGITYPSGDLEQPFPSCPLCRQPLRQYSVRRYGRVINMATLEQMSKRYISSSASKYTGMVSELATIESEFRDSRARFLRVLLAPSASQRKMQEDIDQRISSFRRIEGKLSLFIRDTSEQQQPAQKLYEMTVSQKKRILDNTSPTTALYVGLDKRSHILAKLLKAQVDLVKATEWCLILNDIKKPNATLGNLSATTDWLVTRIRNSVLEAIKNCHEAIWEADEQKFWAFEIEGRTHFANLVAMLRQLPPTQDSQEGLDQAFEDAKAGLQKSAQLCTEGKFRNVDKLKEMVVAAEKRLQEDTFYQGVTLEEFGRVVEAMTGEFTAQGHWYRCANGHPFAIGECGLPMEEALCPECGANVGGNHHQLVAGVKAEEWT